MEKLQYELTFKTRTEGTGAKDTAQAVKDIRSETDRFNALGTAEKARVNTIAFYDLDAAVKKNTATVRQATSTQAENDAQRARAIQSVRKIREELNLTEGMQRRFNAAQAASAAGMNVAKGAGQNLSFQLQDIAVQLQAGTKLSTVLSQQLPQLFSGLGAKGAAAGAVFAIGALIYNLITAKDKSDAAREAADKLAEKLQELVDLKAHESAEAYGLAIENTTRRLRDLAAIQIKQLGTTNEIEDANRRAEASQDDLTEAALRYLAATTGIDVSAKIAALKQKDLQRDAAAATEDQTLKVEQQKAAYAELNRQIDELKANAAAWEKQRQDLDTQASGLAERAQNAGAMGRPGEQGDLEAQLANVKAKADALDRMLKAVPQKLDDLTAQAFAQASEIDAALATADANIKAINADLESKSTAAELDASLQQNRELTAGLTNVIGQFQAATPAQAEAVATIKGALEDQVLTANEIAAVGRALQTLITTNNTALNGNTVVMEKLVQGLLALESRQKAADQKINALLNRQ
jgi:cell division protein FtsB